MDGDRFVLKPGDVKIRRGQSPLDIETMQRIMLEVDRGVPREQSTVKLSVAERQFREAVTREITEAKRHPRYRLHFTPEL